MPEIYYIDVGHVIRSKEGEEQEKIVKYAQQYSAIWVSQTCFMWIMDCNIVRYMYELEEEQALDFVANLPEPFFVNSITIKQYDFIGQESVIYNWLDILEYNHAKIEKTPREISMIQCANIYEDRFWQHLNSLRSTLFR